MKTFVQLSVFALLCLLFQPSEAALAQTYPKRPRLILTLVIDQFRADYLTRFVSRFGSDGFRYLMTRGAYFPYGQYDILHSTTGPGHSTILTGAYPYQSGIPLNYWFDQEKGAEVYCTEDQSAQMVGASGTGQSPRSLVATTVGDELKNAGIPSRVVSLALKDRAAILMGGHRADLAFWFDNKGPGWVSSNYYLPGGKLPGWLAQLNQGIRARKGEKYVWNVSGKPTGFSAPDAVDYQTQKLALGKGFPHEALFGSREAFAMPLGLDLTEAAAEKAVDAYKLGAGKGTDLLAISFSNHDYMAHAYGPNSLEMEEMTVKEDKVIAKFLNYLKKKVPGGLKDVVIVLTADHGAPLSPEWLKAHKIDAGRISQKDLGARINQRLNDKFGKPSAGDWVLFVYDMDIFLNRKAIQEKKLDAAQVQAEAKQALAGVTGLAQIITASEVRDRKLPPLQHERQILKTFYPGRSGDLMLIPKPYWVEEGWDVVIHMTGYNFDRTVPVILAGPNIKPGVYSRIVEVVDIAPTLSFLSGVLMPSLSEGRVLSEALSFAH